MAERAICKGHLRLELVSCAVQLSTAVSDTGKIAFRTLNRATGNPVKIEWVDSVTDKPVEDKVKGYELDKDEYLIIEDKEIDEARPEGTKKLTLGSFVDRASVPDAARCGERRGLHCYS